MVNAAVQLVRARMRILRRVSVLRSGRRDLRGRLVLGVRVRRRVVVTGLLRRGAVAAFEVVALRVHGRRVVAASEGALSLAVDEDRSVDELH